MSGGEKNGSARDGAAAGADERVRPGRFAGERVPATTPEFVCGAPDCTFGVRANDGEGIVEYVR